MKSQIFCILKINWCIPFSPHFLLESRCVNRTLSRRTQIQLCDNYDNYMKLTNERFLRVILRVICLLRLFRKCFIFIWGSHFIVGISFVTYGDFMYSVQSILNFECNQYLWHDMRSVTTHNFNLVFTYCVFSGGKFLAP